MYQRLPKTSYLHSKGTKIKCLKKLKSDLYGNYCEIFFLITQDKYVCFEFGLIFFIGFVFFNFWRKKSSGK